MELTDEQRPIVEAPVDARLLVTAGPGTGKTHTLIARLGWLVETAGLSPGHEILVLSFSRAAVREIRRRLGDATGGAAYAQALTFDSFATRLLSELVPGGAWLSQGYDERVRSATTLIAGGSSSVIAPADQTAAREVLGAYQHILVDEVQDLVGVRAELVKALLETCPGGFSLFGDPAQGIYSFLLDGADRATGSRVLYEWVERRFAADLERHMLTMAHRFETTAARRALWAGPGLNAPSPDYDDVLARLQDTCARLTCVGTIETAVDHIRRLDTRTAVLTRTNGEALLVSRTLHGLGVAHAYRRPATDRMIPAWIAILLNDVEHGRMGHSAFLERAHERLPEGSPSPDAAWRLLKRLDGPPYDSLDIAHVADAVRSGYVPDELVDEPQADVTVSTVHRAKGLEFDCVVVLEPNGLRDETDAVEIAEEARVLYVALTRPKRFLFRMARMNTWGIQQATVDERWIRRYQRGGTTNFEIRGDDTHAADPAGGHMLPRTDPVGLQCYLASCVRRGDPVTLRLLTPAELDEPYACYAVEHRDRLVGVTSERFAETMYRALKPYPSWRVKWPVRIEDIYVEGVDTVAGTGAAGRRCGLGSSGLWLRIRVAGLGKLRFE